MQVCAVFFYNQVLYFFDALRRLQSRMTETALCVKIWAISATSRTLKLGIQLCCIVQLTIIPRVRVGYEMADSQ